MTPHINADENDIAKIVIMPGDPKRVKFIADNYLKDAKMVNTVRLNLAYTGYYENNKITVMASGMGMPSMGIYAYELFKEYNVDTIIRLGSCGSYYKEIGLGDIILAEKAYTLSNFAFQYSGTEQSVAKSSTFINQKIVNYAYNNNIEIKIGNVNTSDVFYHDADDPKIKENFCLGVEMECFALFYIARKLGKTATAILTVSDNLVTKDELSSADRETKFTKAIELVLNTVNNL